MTEPPQPAPVAPPPAEAMAERRHVTVMFCDLVDSTGIAAKLDAEGWRDLVGAYIDAASAAVAEMGGHVAKKLGDGLLALFGYPIAHENDVERAVRAALSIQRALHELNRKNAGTPGADGSVPVLLIMTDETGFGAASAFGGPIRTPTTRPPLADPKRETKVSDGLSPGGGRHHFFVAISFSIALSSIASANSLFSLAFSSSSDFKRLASDTAEEMVPAFAIYR
jgi:hypothetical protein